MTALRWIAILLFSGMQATLIAGQPTVVSLFFGTPEGYWRVPVVEIPGGFRINLACAEAGACEALRALHRAHHEPSSVTGRGYRAAPKSIRCLEVGGKSAILRDASNNQFDFCRFSDGSMIESVDLVKR